MRILPTSWTYRHLALIAALFTVIAVAIASRVELGEEWAAWVQAIGSVIALGFAVALPAMEQARRRQQETALAVEEAKDQFKKLYIHTVQAASLIQTHTDRLRDCSDSPWWDSAHHIEMTDSLIERIEAADASDIHPSRVAARNTLLTILFDFKAALRLDPVPTTEGRIYLARLRLDGLVSLREELELTEEKHVLVP